MLLGISLELCIFFGGGRGHTFFCFFPPEKVSRKDHLASGGVIWSRSLRGMRSFMPQAAVWPAQAEGLGLDARN